MKKRLFLLILFILSVTDFKTETALSPQENPESVLPTLPLPPEIEEYLLEYVVGDFRTEPYFIEAVKAAEPLVRVNHQFKDIIVNALVSRFKDANASQSEFARLILQSKLRPFAIEILKKAGASLEKENSAGFTPLVFALRHGHLGVALMLIDKGADVNKVSSREGGIYPIKAATEQYRNSEEYAQVITAMINAGADLKVKDVGKELLLMAITREDEALVKLLLKKGVSPNFSHSNFSLFRGKLVSTESRGEFISPLEKAINNGNFKLVKLLLEKGADPNYKSGDNTSLKIARDLLGQKGDTPEKAKEREAIVEILKEKGAKE